MKPVLQSIRVQFEQEGLEIAVTYGHGDGQPNPGTKKRTTRATRMARAGLQAALEGLDRGEALWGGHGTNTHESTDMVVIGEEVSSFSQNVDTPDLQGEQKKGVA